MLLNYSNFILEKIKTGSKIIDSMKKIPISGAFYHGSHLDEDLNVIKEFEFGYSDYDAIWFTDDEYIAEKFCDYNMGTGYNNIKCVYKITIEPTKNIADINRDIYEEILDFYGFYDLRESIETLKQLGYDGWRTSGSIDGHAYVDYAVFDLNLIYIQEVKFLIDDIWTDYIKIELADESIKNKINNNEN